MKWLTRKEVREYATTPRKALEIAIKHWWQNATAKTQDYYGDNDKYDAIDGDLCGLCKYYEIICSNCPLSSSLPNCHSDSSQYQISVRRYKKWRDDTPENFKAWQEEARKMHKLLCSLRK